MIDKVSLSQPLTLLSLRYLASIGAIERKIGTALFNDKEAFFIGIWKSHG